MMTTLKESFIVALKNNENDFGVDLSDAKCQALATYYERVTAWNKLLHLVAPCPPEEFAVRHVLESLTLLEYLPPNARLADIGTGAGLPSIPCLIVREDLHGTLIESVAKKTIFLREIISKLNLQPRTVVFNLRVKHVPPPEIGFVTCRALDKFVEQLPDIVSWAKDAENVLLFGGDNLRDELNKRNLKFDEKLIPKSERRFIFAVEIKNN
jgi:16S rRNA (guanine527-N7)-methyltransferase